MSGFLSGQDRSWISEKEEKELDEYLANLPSASWEEAMEVTMYLLLALMPFLALYIDFHFKQWTGIDFDLNAIFWSSCACYPYIIWRFYNNWETVRSGSFSSARMKIRTA